MGIAAFRDIGRQGEIQREQDWFFQKEEFEQDSIKGFFLPCG